ncbi:hypothetical protein TrVFT333_005984 [Trichoderma virens FT-333]|nr:hypothetical protein TrVFT333_005984 [Trichoderma virens FT-333]
MATSTIVGKQDVPSETHRETSITEVEESSSARSSSDSEPPPYEEALIKKQQALALASSANINDAKRIIAIPATNADVGSAFLRAYPSALANSSISKTEFLEFVDQLNRNIVQSPPLRVLGAASDIVGFVPEPTAQIVSAAAGVSAMVGTYAMSKIRSEVVIRQANKEIFNPKGLEVQIVKLKTVAKLTNMPILNEKGDVDKKSPVLESLQSLAEANELKTISAQERRLRALDAWISPLEIEELPPVANPSNVLSKVDVYISEAERKSAEKSMLKKRIRVNKRHDKATQKALEKYESSMERYNEKEKSVDVNDRRASRDLERIEERRQRAQQKYEKEMEKAEKDYQKKDREERSLRRISFLVVVPKGKDN